MPVFPSKEWFDAVRERYNQDEAVRAGGGGACDARAGFKIGDRTFLAVFEGYECTETAEIDAADLDRADFYLEMSPEEWREMIENIRANGGADLEHTLNTLDLDRPEPLVRTAGDDQFKADMFYRFNQTFQYFFDEASEVETEFDEELSP